jgi:hypothetical protein
LTVALLAVVSCGKKGDPLPPLRLVPAPPDELKLRQSGDRLQLTFRAPARNEDGSSDKVDLESARVMRRVREIPTAPEAPTETPEPSEEVEAEAPLGEPAPAAPPFASEAVVASEIPSAEPGESKAHEELIDPAWIGKRVEYAVIYRNGSGRESARSEIVAIDPVAPLARPALLAAEAGDGFVSLRWSAPQEAPPAVAYAVFRRLEEAYREAPLNAEPLSEPSFQDDSAVFGAENCYLVEAVLAAEGGASISSLPSEEICIVPQDRFAPGAPGGLVAVPSEKGILLSWTDVDARDRKAYRVYRGESVDGLALLAEVPDPSYTDETAPLGEKLFYAVTAIDSAPRLNESELSAIVEVLRQSPERN